MYAQLIRFFWGLPKAHPTASTILSGLGGLSLLVVGIGLMGSTSSAYHGQSSVGGGIAALLAGLATLGLVVYAAIDTQTFQNWARPDGTYGHALVRWAGPVFLILMTLELIIALWIIDVIARSSSRR